jgi:hypothetical protein
MSDEEGLKVSIQHPDLLDDCIREKQESITNCIKEKFQEVLNRFSKSLTYDTWLGNLPEVDLPEVDLPTFFGLDSGH